MASKRLTGNAEPTELSEFKTRGERQSKDCNVPATPSILTIFVVILSKMITVNTSHQSCERCGMNAQFNWDGVNVCGSGCYELLTIANPNSNKELLELKLFKLIGHSRQDISDAMGNVVREGKSVKIGASTYSRYYPEWDSWVIELNKYHRDNLIWLFNVIGYPGGKGVEPFHFANTGDWVGEIPLMLRKPLQSSPVLENDDHSNKSIENLKSDIEYWLKRK